MEIPTLTTARLVLRAPAAADLHDYAALWADPEVTAQIGLAPLDRASSWASLLRHAGSWLLLGYGQWIVCDRGTGGFLGFTGFMQALRGHGPAFDAFPEGGWVLSRAAIGRGLGREAAEAAHGWFDAHVGGPSVCQIAEANAASQALAARLGYAAFASHARAAEDRVILFRRG